MVAIPVGHYEATMIFRVAGVNKDITWAHGFDSGVTTPASIAALASDMRAAASTAARPYAAAAMDVSWQFRGVSITFESDTGPIIGESIVPLQGTATAAPVPVNCAVLVSKNTAEGGRRNRGRFFAPPCFPAESVIDAAGNIPTANVAALQTAYSNLYGDWDALIDDLELFHQTAPFTPTTVTSWTVQPLLATQRRRMR